MARLVPPDKLGCIFRIYTRAGTLKTPSATPTAPPTKPIATPMIPSLIKPNYPIFILSTSFESFLSFLNNSNEETKIIEIADKNKIDPIKISKIN